MRGPAPHARSPQAPPRPRGSSGGIRSAPHRLAEADSTSRSPLLKSWAISARRTGRYWKIEASASTSTTASPPRPPAAGPWAGTRAQGGDDRWSRPQAPARTPGRTGVDGRASAAIDRACPIIARTRAPRRSDTAGVTEAMRRHHHARAGRRQPEPLVEAGRGDPPPDTQREARPADGPTAARPTACASYASSGFSGRSRPRASTPPPARPGRGSGRGASRPGRSGIGASGSPGGDATWSSGPKTFSSL